MFLKTIRNNFSFQLMRCYSEYKEPPRENPLRRTLRILGNDIQRLRKNPKLKAYEHDNSDIEDFPSYVDVAIVGGGIMGSSIAYWLKEKTGDGLNVAVIEKDPTYCKSSTVLSVGGLRQQFSLPENILMSQFGANFFRQIKKSLGEDVDIQFTPYGYLLLANEETAPILEENFKIQKQYNVKNELLSNVALKSKFPWLNTDGIVLGCHGLENEGWFDPWSLLQGFKRKAISLGADYVNGELVDFVSKNDPYVYGKGITAGTFQKINKMLVKTKDDRVREINFAICIIAAGAHSGQIAKMANIGNGEGLLCIPLPVEPRKRYVYCFNTQDTNMPGINTPMVFDPSGTYFRREGAGNNFIGGRAPSPENEPDISNLDVDHEFFNTDVWPHLAKRVPAFSGVKVNGSWAGYYEYNTFDENGIIGNHPYYGNFYFATGFSGHGIQQAPAVGLAISELIIGSGYKNIDLTRLGFDRLLVNKPMYESNIF